MTDLPEKEHISTPQAPQKETAAQSEGLSNEVISAGVTMHPTVIPVPPPVAGMGVNPAGVNVPAPSTTTLPLTDDQIAQGLAGSMRESFRWLAEWCLRRLKQVHIGLKSVHGKLTRIQTHA